MSRIMKVLLFVMVMVIIGVAVYAFTDANKVSAAKDSQSVGVISGYTVSGIIYNLDASDKTRLRSVEFDLNQAAASVQVRLISTGHAWYTCVHGAGFHWTCTPDSLLNLSAIDELSVIAGDASATP